MQIGDITLDNPVVLAPMAGVTDKAFRILVKEQGCGLVYTEMVSAKALAYKNQHTLDLIDLKDELPPINVQLFGSEPDIMVAGAIIAVEHGAELLDINMGCPVPKVIKNQEGSALMLDPDLAALIVEKIVGSVSVPVTVKIRKGWDEGQVNAVEFAKRMEAAGAALIAIHGRTRSQMYSGKADWKIIKAVKEAVEIPVLGNGDIFKASEGLRMLRETGCDGVMVGRGSLGYPWLFAELVALLSKGQEIPPPTLSERMALAIRQGELSAQYADELIAMKEMRKHVGWYFKGLPYGAKMRNRVNKITTLAELKELLLEYTHNSYQLKDSHLL